MIFATFTKNFTPEAVSYTEEGT